MKKLDLELFTKVQNDLESRQLHILAALQQAQREFNLNKLYPTLAELIETHRLISHILKEMGRMKGLFPKSIKSIDLEKQTIEFEYADMPDLHLEQVKSLIEWTLPKLDNIIREGATIFDYVEKRLKIATVGIVPQYVKEGYLFIPDLYKQELALYRYEMSVFTHFENQYRTLKTQLLRRYDEQKVVKELQSIKLELIKEHKELPNPATYSVQTDIDFPFDETVLPIVKRILTGLLSSKT